MTDVTRDYNNHVTRARVTAISRFPVTCVTTLEKGGDKAPRYRHVRANFKTAVLRSGIMQPHRRARNLLCSLWRGRGYPLRQGGEWKHERQQTHWFSALCPTLVQYMPFGKGFSRALSHELQHSWKQTRTRASRPISRQIPMDCLDEIQDRGGWGEKPERTTDFMSSPSFAAAPKKFGGVLSENLVGHC